MSAKVSAEHTRARKLAWSQSHRDEINQRRRAKYAAGGRENILAQQRVYMRECPICAKCVRANYLAKHVLRKHHTGPLPPPDTCGECAPATEGAKTA
jgi:hypothetical protein